MTPATLASVIPSRSFSGFILRSIAASSICGKEVCIIGRSMVVGKPLSMLLLKENATVTVCHSKTEDLKAVASRADILVRACGNRALRR